MNEDILDHEPEESGQANETESVRHAGFGIRVGASLLDSLVFLPLIGLDYYNVLQLKNLQLALVLTMISALYKPLMEYHFGATVGKMLVRIKVVDYRLQAISLQQALLRYLPWMFSVVVNVLATIAVFQAEGFQEIQDFWAYAEFPGAAAYDKWIQFTIWIVPVSAFGILFNPYRQAVHDQVARTFCIHTT